MHRQGRDTMQDQQSLLDKSVPQPLAARLRPDTIDDIVGQQHLLGEGRVLRRIIQQDAVSSMIFWGPPGVGKTTLAKYAREGYKTDNDEEFSLLDDNKAVLISSIFALNSSLFSLLIFLVAISIPPNLYRIYQTKEQVFSLLSWSAHTRRFPID